MNSDDFSQLVERRLDKIRSTLSSKGKEYSTKDNKLHNFEKAAIKRHTTREIALQGMLTKHEVSIDDIIAKTANDEFPSREVIDEKIGDIINYYILLEACLVDRLKNVSKSSVDTEYQGKIDAIKIKAEQELKDIRTNPSNLAEGQRWIREQSIKILKEQQDKHYVNTGQKIAYRVIDVDLYTGILTLWHQEAGEIKVTYFELSNDRTWKQEDS